MRPALLRLLKRPSALSVIDTLISTPSGIEHLRAGISRRCTRCASSSPAQRGSRPLEASELKNDAHTKTLTKPSNFRVHDIRSPLTKPPSDKGLGSSRYSVRSTWKQLALQPEILDYESDVGHHQDIGTRLVDDPTHRADFSLWLELLRYRQRRYGDNGTLDIWEGITTRTGSLQLPVNGEYADVLWQSFVDLGLEREAILNEVADYALELWNETGNRWPKFYQSIVGRFIERGMRQQAVKWHKRLHHPHLSHPNDIIHCFNSAVRDNANSVKGVHGFGTVEKRPLASRLSTFRAVCKHTDGHEIYSKALSTLIEKGELTEALRMHEFLLRRGDHPRSHEQLEPLLEHAKDFGSPTAFAELQDIYNDLRSLHTKTETFVSDIPRKETQTLKRNEGDWIEEKPFKDEFGARVFATTALSFDMILSGLKMFSVQAIGPQSLREMATRARGSQDLLEKIERLENEGISIGGTVFARLLRRLATENREILLYDLLHSDQHPDMLQDSETQEKLLVSYYMVRDWRQYNLCLAALKELHGEGRELVNIHVRKHLAAGEWTFASKVIDDMLIQGLSLTRGTIDFMANRILTPRRVGVGPARHPDLHLPQELAFTFRFLQRIAHANAYIPPKVWVELIKRLGMTDCWDELRSCCLWLARHYSSSGTWSTALSSDNTHPSTARVVQAHGEQMLERIFSKQMLDAIVAWGFIVQPPTRVKSCYVTGGDGEPLAPFVRGLMLLRELQQTGIPVRSGQVRKVCEQRLVMLYGPPVVSSRPRNRVLRRENPHTCERVIADINRAWGELPLFDSQSKSRLNRRISPHSHWKTAPLARSVRDAEDVQ
ncbi:uncharacterized protein BJX67DRAFT_282792 [Aspergillus lucknowensis]|uniref:Pentatricopeptide repeat domain-containing protein n=1 Tax=Aspergillus lucknowensis TaxID=176173 RepID=A0ABR4M1Z9_9EURO